MFKSMPIYVHMSMSVRNVHVYAEHGLDMGMDTGMGMDMIMDKDKDTDIDRETYMMAWSGS
jgi:hypothetical protein